MALSDMKGAPLISLISPRPCQLTLMHPGHTFSMLALRQRSAALVTKLGYIIYHMEEGGGGGWREGGRSGGGGETSIL